MKRKKVIPTITMDDVEWATKIMCLPEKAFDKDRQEAIRSMSSIDIQACPGSGKTTLLVAKLAILAKKWKSATKGICVLSHTNVAREEIEKKLGNSPVGQKLLSYPHFVGTIHGFINEFIALPWIRSKGYPINVIETETVKKIRTRSLPLWIQNDSRLQSLSNNVFEPLNLFCDLPDEIWGRLSINSENCRQVNAAIKRAIRASWEKGFFTFNEMFYFADELLELCPELILNLRKRFPAIMIDEAQDCSEQQNKILANIFPESNKNLVRQRYGDSNQAIFNSFMGESAETEPFPSPCPLKISNSLRFSDEIAKLADPLGLTPYKMKGKNSKSLAKKSNNTIFLFENHNISEVLPQYGKLLIKTFTEKDMKSSDRLCYAVGMVHNRDRIEPRGANVSHYFSTYTPEASRSAPTLNCLVDYVNFSLSQYKNIGETFSATNLISKGIIFGMNQILSEKLTTFGIPYRNLLKWLEYNNVDTYNLKSWFLKIFANGAIGRSDWYKSILPDLAMALPSFLRDPFLKSSFIEWDQTTFQQNHSQKNEIINEFVYQENDREIKIKLGSIHSVKGQTHLATLVFDTFWYDNNLVCLKDWLKGTNIGGMRQGKRNLTRLKCHYVAMTRPTDLLCMAIKKSNITDSDVVELVKAGWQIEEV